MAEQSGCLEWNITGQGFDKFINASNGDEFASETFGAGSFVFQCKVYPNGRKKEQKGCVMLYFVLQTSLANKISKITVKARLYCPQTLCDWKHIQHLKKDNAGIGWHCKNMLLEEVRLKNKENDINHLKFICEITILRIEYKSNINTNPKSIGTNVYHKLCKIDMYGKYEWTVSDKLLSSFQAAHNGKFYHSPDYNYGCWCTSIAPNGANSKDIGNVKVGLQLLQLPPGVGRIKCKFTISSNYQNIKCDGRKEFGYNSTFIAWGDGTLKTADLATIDTQITFFVEITILKIYDEFNEEINRNNWHKYGIVNNIPIPNIMTQDLSEENHNDSNSMDIDFTSVYSPKSPTTQQFVPFRPNTSRTSHKYTITHSDEIKESSPLKTDSSSQRRSFTDDKSTTKRSKTGTGRPSDIINPSRTSLDIQQNFAMINAQSAKMNDISSKMEEIESYRNEDKQHLISIEKMMINLQRSGNRIQQQQFDQGAMLKQCINDLSSTMQRLTNEVVFMKNKVKKMENQIHVQQKKINYYDHETNTNPSPKHNQRRSSKLIHASKKSKSSKQSKKSNGSDKFNESSKRKIDSALATWLKHDCGFPQYVNLFADNGYDTMEIVKEMTKFELEEIGITLKGHQFKIIKEIQKLEKTRKHHRQKVDDKMNAIDMLHVANYLTPVGSPAGSEAPTLQTTDDTIPQIPLSPITATETHGRGRSSSLTSAHSKFFLHLDSHRHYMHTNGHQNPRHLNQNGHHNMNMNRNHNYNGHLHSHQHHNHSMSKTQRQRHRGQKQHPPQHQNQNHNAYPLELNDNDSDATESIVIHDDKAQIPPHPISTNMGNEKGGNGASPCTSPSLSTSQVSYTTTATETTAATNMGGYHHSYQPHHGMNRSHFYSPRDTNQGHTYKRGHHSNGQNTGISNMNQMWECSKCHTSNIEAVDKCEFCENERDI